MPWNPWIQIEPNETTDETVQQLYERTRVRSTSLPPDIVRLNSLTPSVAGCINDLQKAIHRDAKGLSIKEQEISALLVASYNGCVH
jgi:hypothetical protein